MLETLLTIGTRNLGELLKWEAIGPLLLLLLLLLLVVAVHHH